jgi:hypothetical protein
MLKPEQVAMLGERFERDGRSPIFFSETCGEHFIVFADDAPLPDAPLLCGGQPIAILRASEVTALKGAGNAAARALMTQKIEEARIALQRVQRPEKREEDKRQMLSGDDLLHGILDIYEGRYVDAEGNDGFIPSPPK